MLMRTVPRCPLLRPAITSTISPRRIFRIVSLPFVDLSPWPLNGLEHFRRQRNNPHILAFTQLTANRAEYSGSTRRTLWIDQHRRIVVELNVAAIRAAIFLSGAYDHRAHHITLFHAGIWLGLLH